MMKRIITGNTVRYGDFSSFRASTKLLTIVQKEESINLIIEGGFITLVECKLKSKVDEFHWFGVSILDKTVDPPQLYQKYN